MEKVRVKLVGTSNISDDDLDIICDRITDNGGIIVDPYDEPNIVIAVLPNLSFKARWDELEPAMVNSLDDTTKPIYLAYKSIGFGLNFYKLSKSHSHVAGISGTGQLFSSLVADFRGIGGYNAEFKKAVAEPRIYTNVPQESLKDQVIRRHIRPEKRLLLLI